MPTRLPPMNTLRAFEAAARNLSFTLAAEELHITQAAVSHQIKVLEQALGVRLFRRLNRAIRLTEEGQEFVGEVRKALSHLATAVEKLAAPDAGGPLTISVLPSFASKWLVPRLGRFRDKHPEIDVRISPSTQLTDFRRDDVDLVVRYGKGEYEGLHSVWLMTEDIFPVCSPALLNGPNALSKPEDLRRHTLLHDDGYVDWTMWLLVAGVSGIDLRQGPFFTDSAFVIQAAAEGQGVALARGALAAGDIAAGRLVKPFNIAIPTEYAYYVLSPKATSHHPKIAAFREWLLEEVAADDTAPPVH
ncbi:MAG: transcriptional regulator GcvA [Proteobacteria bacterium]|nr:transcriptional regulator GcvA [Pseudomonadota bacterium]MCK4869096.1 transcriptional regulator GcvA [Alphaproteobacteria bacterium]